MCRCLSFQTERAHHSKDDLIKDRVEIERWTPGGGGVHCRTLADWCVWGAGCCGEAVVTLP
jgi:hypothetical protein